MYKTMPSIVIGLTGTIFVIDLFSRASHPWPWLYLIPLIMAHFLTNRAAPLLLAATATIFTSIGTFDLLPFSAHEAVLSDRLLAIALLWGSIPLLKALQQQPSTGPVTIRAALHDEQQRLRHLFGERVKELTALHRAVRLLQDSAKPVDEVLNQIVSLIPPAWQYPEITAARITVDTVVVTTPDFVESPWKQSASWGTVVGEQGSIEVIYRDVRPPEAEGPFLAEERDLINSLADSLSSYMNRRRAEQALREAHERLRALSQQLMEVQEIERRRLAHDLHDEIGQALTVVKMNLQTMQRLSDTSAITTPLNDSKQVIDQILQHIRNLSLDLRPILLDDLGLVPAVRWYLSRQAERTGWNIDVDADESMPPLPQSVATACFRIIQEAITNIIRHSQATRISVSLRHEVGNLRLSIRDNGKGFDVAQALNHTAGGKTMGLLGMHERVRFLNGTIMIDSAPGQGAEIRIQIPLSPFSSPSPNEVPT